MKYKITLLDQEVEIEFTPDEKIQLYEEIHLDLYKYGVLDLIVKNDPKGEKIVENGVFSFIKYPSKEAYIVDCRDYEKICNITEIEELKRSQPVKRA